MLNDSGGTTRREWFARAASAMFVSRWAAAPRSFAARVPADDIARLRTFRAHPQALQEKIALELIAALQKEDDRWLREVSAAAERGRALVVAKKPAGWKAHKARGEDAWRYDGLPLPLRNEYLWGHRIVRQVEERPPIAVGEGKERLTLEAQSRSEWLLAPLRGLVPDADLAVAALEHELDTERDADRFQCFLESWRNGSESFYVALDRTAGTDRSVFFFDAMLAEFAQLFADEYGRDRELAKSLQKKHDAVLNAFLVYRQYRALREAAAFAMVLPSDVPLPPHLARYETRSGGYSFRDDVGILLQLRDASLDKIASAVLEATPPLPKPLWSTDGRYAGIESFQEGFGKTVEAALHDDPAGGTEVWLASWLERSRATTARIRALTIEVLDDHTR